jgi:hypothetical protein
MVMKNTRATRVLHLCSFTVVCLLGFSFRNEAKIKKKNDTHEGKKNLKAYERLKP